VLTSCSGTRARGRYQGDNHLGLPAYPKTERKLSVISTDGISPSSSVIWRPVSPTATGGAGISLATAPARATYD
jgi:hypothetical protein